MKRVLNVGCVVLFLACRFFIPDVFAQNSVKGLVRSTSGTPIAKVWVHCGGSRDTETDARGEFTLSCRGKVIFFRHDDYKPVALISSKLSDLVAVTMENSKGTEATVPSCEQSPNQFFSYHKINIPEGDNLKLGHDVDYTEFYLKHESEKSVYYLHGMEGPHATIGFPMERLITDSVEFTAGTRRNGEVVLLDFRGLKADGTFWRFVGTVGFLLSYENASLAASTHFDKIINGACRAR